MYEIGTLEICAEGPIQSLGSNVVGLCGEELHPSMTLIGQCVFSAFGVFPKWSRIFTEFNDFSKFRETDKSLRHELG